MSGLASRGMNEARGRKNNDLGTLRESGFQHIPGDEELAHELIERAAEWAAGNAAHLLQVNARCRYLL